MVVTSLGFLFSPLYSRLEAEEAGNPETPTGVDPKRPPKPTLSSQRTIRQISKMENYLTITALL